MTKPARAILEELRSAISEKTGALSSADRVAVLQELLSDTEGALDAEGE